MHSAPLPRAVAILAVALAVAGCLPGQRSDPGDLEVRNLLRDPVIAMIGGRPNTIPPCSTIPFTGVELRGVRIMTPTGLDLMRVDPPAGTPIGPRRFIVVDGSAVYDLRTVPNWARPGEPGTLCHGTLFDLQRALGLQES